MMNIPATIMASYGHVVIVFTTLFSVSDGVCNFANCVDLKDMLNVHIIPHTHDDIGWLKTIDEYYYGDKNDIQRAGVQYILDSVIPELLKDVNRRFIYVEMGFFWRWWQEQSPEMQSDVKSLVEKGQLEFIGGGWSMNDEAASHYSCIIDQMTLGLKFIRDNFGQCARPLAVWQIDPFGHSKEQASLFAQMGMDGLFLGRIDFADKKFRVKLKEMQMIWSASSSLGEEAWLFTEVLPNNYSPPPGFCYDILCNDQPIRDNPDLEGYNVDERVDAFINYTLDIADWYETNNVIITMGEDFNYQMAGAWYKNLDKLIKYVNERQTVGSKINLFYSTPSCYLKAVHDSKPSLNAKLDDFFPYFSDPHAYWTGYFTSRPALKYLDRVGNNILQATKQLSVFSNLRNYDASIELLRKAMANMQHHDAVTGTSKQAVAEDYAKVVYTGMEESSRVISDALMILSNEFLTSEMCFSMNISSCPVTEQANSFAVFVYNPVSLDVFVNVRIPVSIQSSTMPIFNATTVNGIIGANQLCELPKSIHGISGRKSEATHELVIGIQIPALTALSISISKTNEFVFRPNTVPWGTRLLGDYYTVGYDHLSIKLNARTGLLERIIRDEFEIEVTQYYAWYVGMSGTNKVFNKRASGAYVFRPDGTAPITLSKAKIEKIIDGDVVCEIHQVFNDWISQVVRIYANQDHIEFNWIVGPIPIEDNLGKEVIFRIESELDSGEIFFTDSNGRQIMKRRRDSCSTSSCLRTEPISSNYYPVNSKMFLKDETRDIGMALLTDRSQGGTSLQSGGMDLMIHRRLLYDDAFGVGEALNETAFGKGLVIRGKTQLVLLPLEHFDEAFRTLSLRNYLSPIISVSSRCPPDNFIFEGINSQYLPPNINILTLEFYGNVTVLLRLENFFDINDNTHLAGPATVDISLIFTTMAINKVQEMILSANELKSEVHRLRWNYQKTQRSEINENFIYTLKPMEIKTFLLTVSHTAK